MKRQPEDFSAQSVTP